MNNRTASGILTPIAERAFAPADGASLAVFRIFFGCIGLASAVRCFAYGWIDELYLRPQFFFSYPGFEWIRPWPGAGMYVHYGVMALAACGVIAGYRSRLSTAVFTLAFTYAQLIDRTNYLNHAYLVSLIGFILVIVPAGRALGIDAWRRHDEARLVPFWTIALLRFQLAVVYFFGGVAKLNADWLVDAQPLRIWLPARADLPIVGPLLELPESAWLFSWSGALFDLAIPFLLFSRRTRGLAYVLVLVFHFLTAVLFPFIGLFPWMMILLTTIFFAPDWPRRLVPLAESKRGTPPPPLPAPRARFAATAALCAYGLVQIVVPLRSFLHPGNTMWTEDGFRFSWRVMVMEKYAQTTFRVTDRSTGDRWIVDPSDELTPLQVRMMSTQPDMITDYARHVAERWAVRGRTVEVRPVALASLNGRPARSLIGN